MNPNEEARKEESQTESKYQRHSTDWVDAQAEAFHRLICEVNGISVDNTAPKSDAESES